MRVTERAAVLCFGLLLLVFPGCKARKDDLSTTKDIVSMSSDSEVTLTYVDQDPDDKGRSDRLVIFQGTCGVLRSDFKFRDLWHEDLRNSCKKNATKMLFDQFEPLWDAQYLKTSQATELTKLDLAVKAWVIQDLRKINNTTNRGEAIPAAVNYSNPAATQAHSDWITAMEIVLSSQKNNGDRPATDNNLPPVDSSNNDSKEGIFTTDLTDEPGGQSYSLNFSVNGAQRARAIEFTVQPISGEECFLAIDSASAYAADGQSVRLRKILLSSKSSYQLSDQENLTQKYRVRFINASLKGFACKFTAQLIELPREGQRNLVRRDEVMRNLMSKKHHRLAHFLWHSARNSYLQPGATNQDRANIDAMGWKPPRPVIYKRNSMGFAEIDYEATAKTGAGEDFLYMHRVMIAEVREELTKEGLNMYEPWSTLPLANDSAFPLVARENNLQSDEGFRQMLSQQDEFSPANIKKFTTLSALGTHIEFKLHNAMHTRWAAANWEVRPVSDDPIANASNRTNWQWDRRSYDHLADPYSAHVNPIFWHLHGWVDQKIDDWLKAKGLVLKADCGQKPNCISWRSDVWVGPDHSRNVLTVGSSSIEEISLKRTRRLLGQNAFMNSLTR